MITTRRTTSKRGGESTQSTPTRPNVSLTGNGAEGTGSALDEVLDMTRVVTETREAVDNMQKRVTRSVQEIQQDLPESKMRDDSEIQARIKSADFESVQEQAQKDEKDFAAAMQAIQEVSDAMAVEFKSLVTPNAVELGIVEAAKAEVNRLEELVREKEQPGFFRSLPLLRTKHQASLNDLRTQLASARTGIATAETTMKAKLRQRLMEATMDVSVETYVAVSNNTVKIMETRVGELTVQIGIIDGRRVYALKEKENASKRMADLTVKLQQKEMELANEQAELAGLANSTPEYAAKEKIVSALLVEVETTRSDREAALTYFQSKEAALKHLELTHLAAIKLRGRHQARILRLRSDTEERSKMYPAHLLNMKTMSDQAFDKLIREVGVTTDQNISEANAQAIVAADNDFMAGIEEHPELLRKHEAVNKALREHFITMRGRTERMLRMIEEGYEGVNPGNSLWTTSNDAPAGGDSSASPTSSPPAAP